MQGRRTRNAPKLHLSSRLHWAIRLLFVTNWTWRYIVHPPLLCMPFLFGWPPCQRSDMTLVEVSQHAYDYLYIRTIVLFVFLRNSCKPDMVLVYIFVEWTLSESESESNRGTLFYGRIPTWYDIDGSVQCCNVSIANALEILQSCTNPSILCGRQVPTRAIPSPFESVGEWQVWEIDPSSIAPGKAGCMTLVPRWH